MNRDEINDLLADYLGGELQSQDRGRFDDYMASDPSFAEEVAGMRRALVDLRALDEPASKSGSSAGAGMRVRRRALVPALLRYAAMILFAFASGYAARSFSAAAPAVTTPERQQQPSGDRFEQRFVEAYGQSSADSDLARSLIALSRATP